MVFIRKKHHHFQAKVRIPLPLRPSYDDRDFLYHTLATSDSKAAKAQADAWEAGLRLLWLAGPVASSPLPSSELAPAQLRALYHDLRKRAEAGEFLVHTAGEDPVEAGIEWEIDRIADAHEREEELPEEAEFRLAALQDAKASLQDLPVPRRKALEPSFRDLADDYLRLWRTQHGLKDTNTEQQKVATFDLFAGFYGSKPMRGVRKADAATFVDALRQMDPNWARSPAAKEMTWTQLQKVFGGRPKGLSDSTINRHMATVQALWDWASERGHCEGHNPFKGFRRKLKEGRNAQGYVAWEAIELTQLFSPPPKRADLTEIMLVAMHSGMRLDEIASLTVGQVHKDGPVPFMRVIDAKTVAGTRTRWP